ncbi:hypothetical protein T484DRAFT_1954964 [Baffinella frigidus]|nr:hypothetical protein T484DRAFT_1954964 [Cryptophyta sp. CCMP2293]
MLCYVMLCYVMLCYAMLFYAMLCIESARVPCLSLDHTYMNPSLPTPYMNPLHTRPRCIHGAYSNRVTA